MKAIIARVGKAGAEEWDAAWQATAHATWFQSREWAEIWSTYTRRKTRPGPLRIEFEDKFSAILPLSVRLKNKGFSRRHLSSPAGTYGGWLSADCLTAAHASALARWLTHDLGALEWRLNPFDPLQRSLDVAAAPDETHAIDLTPGFDAVARARSKANKAARAGVGIQAATTEADWRAYYAVYEASLARWGDQASSRYRWPLFDEIRRRASPHVRLWLARLHDEVIAGALCFYARQHAVYWHGAADEAHFELRPVNLLMQEAIRDACARGFTWFDLNPSGGHEGVKKFKCSLGAQPWPAPVVTIESSLLGRMRRVLGRLGKAP